MRQRVKNFLRIVQRSVELDEPIYEFGSYQVPSQRPFADLRPMFPGKKYIGCDMRTDGDFKDGVDEVQDLHLLTLKDDVVGTALCFDTLEHVERPYDALEEIHRVLKSDGIVVISSVMKFPIHEHPNDYWRFTPEAFKLILKQFYHSFVGSQGNKKFPHTVVGIGFKGSLEPFTNSTEFIKNFVAWSRVEK